MNPPYEVVSLVSKPPANKPELYEVRDDIGLLGHVVDLGADCWAAEPLADENGQFSIFVFPTKEDAADAVWEHYYEN